jgi:hypothetical protein
MLSRLPADSSPHPNIFCWICPRFDTLDLHRNDLRVHLVEDRNFSISYYENISFAMTTEVHEE